MSKKQTSQNKPGQKYGKMIATHYDDWSEFADPNYISLHFYKKRLDEQDMLISDKTLTPDCLIIRMGFPTVQESCDILHQPLAGLETGHIRQAHQIWKYGYYQYIKNEYPD